MVEVRPDQDCCYMDLFFYKYIGELFSTRGPDRVCFVIAVEKAAQRIFGFIYNLL